NDGTYYDIHQSANLTIVKTLLECGANPNIQNDELMTAIMMICNRKYFCDYVAKKFIYILLKYNINLNLQDNKCNTALMYAIENNNIKFVKILLKKGANLHLKNNDGDTSLILASKYSENSLRLLFKKIDN